MSGSGSRRGLRGDLWWGRYIFGPGTSDSAATHLFFVC